MDAVIDLETYGRREGDAISELGAVAFNPDGGPLIEFCRDVSLASCLQVGLEIEPETLQWRLDKGLKAHHLDGIVLPQALLDFAAFVEEHKPEHIWGHGATFDLPILRVAYRACSLPVPWSQFRDRDTRTRFEDVGLEYKAPGNHDALEDARAEALAIQESYRRLAGFMSSLTEGSC